jgi:hypothetical protein
MGVIAMQMPEQNTIIIIALAAVMVLVPTIAVASRLIGGKGIGWHFIRFNVVTIALPLAGILTISGNLSDGVLALISGVVGFAFGKSGDGNTHA